MRHGATANNVAVPALLQGRRSDLPLSIEGRRQAEETSQFLAGYPLQNVYATPLLRARQTAELIAAPHGLPIEIVAALTEVDVGQWEGRCWEEIADSEPDEYRRFMADQATQPYRGGESLQQVQTRVLPALSQLTQRHTGQLVLIVAHNVVNRVTLAPLLGVPLSSARGIQQHNCGINVLEYRQGKPRLLMVNSVWHLSKWE
jgi:broad specificity phosphatase PhoE